MLSTSVIYIYTDKAADADRMLWEGGWVGVDLGDNSQALLEPQKNSHFKNLRTH
jgi:hypothetical protein